MEKIKLLLDSDKARDIILFLIIIFVGIGSFGMGRLSKNETKNEIALTLPSNEQKGDMGSLTSELETQKVVVDQKETKIATTTEPEINKFFASRQGSKYYHSKCSGGKTIKKENLIYFSSEEEAEGAGYELSATCD